MAKHSIDRPVPKTLLGTFIPSKNFEGKDKEGQVLASFLEGKTYFVTDKSKLSLFKDYATIGNGTLTEV